MKFIGKIAAVAVLLSLVACGGGGGSPGGTGSTGTGGSGSGATVVEGSLAVQTYRRSGDADTAVNSFSSSDVTVTAKATLKDRAGRAVPNAIVTFSETGPGLLAFSPTSATALTNTDGIAEIEFKAATATSLGATQLVATAKITGTASEVTVTGAQNVSISGAGIQDPQSAATAINFSSAVPSDKSIVIAGAGGNGRSEAALLTFTVVDAAGAPLKGVTVDFSAVPSDSVTLSATSGLTNASGQAIATVSSKTVPTSVIIRATVRGRPISTQSDTLTVTTGVATQRGFDLSATKYNLDANLSGDKSTLIVRIVDVNGNPVADGVPVVAQTNYGRVGSSSRGGCTTSNGECSVEYTVQNPRPADGEPVIVSFSTQTGQGALISDTLALWVTGVGQLKLFSSTNNSLVAASEFKMEGLDAKCKMPNKIFWAGTSAGFAPPAGTTVKVRSLTESTTPSIIFGSPTLDDKLGRPAEITVSAVRNAGVALNAANENLDTWRFTFESSVSKTTKNVDISVSADACP